MTLPTIFLGLLIALTYGACYHILRGGSFWRLLLYLCLSVIGFGTGHVVGLWRGWMLLPLGALNFGLSTIGSLVILILGDWLSHVEANSERQV
ncbi:MAG TPA: hypothetical protein VJ821_00305 [Anaerolineales bacterium]|nr:hypothetical protein [Anaerolineales bacterium]